MQEATSSLLQVRDARGSRLSEKDFALGVRRHDQSIWSAWYEEHYRHLYRYAYGKTGSREEAEDIASQTFLEALKGFDRYRDQGLPVLAWLYGIARNLIAQRARKSQREDRALAGSLLEPETSDTDSVPDRLDLLAAIRQLTPEQQDVIVLRFFLSKSTREVAQIMDKKENAVFALQFRAVNSLRRLMTPSTNGHAPSLEGPGTLA